MVVADKVLLDCGRLLSSWPAYRRHVRRCAHPVCRRRWAALPEVSRR